jgi:hypothetical protein
MLIEARPVRHKKALETNIIPNVSVAAPLGCDPIEPGLVDAIVKAPARVQRSC